MQSYSPRPASGCIFLLFFGSRFAESLRRDGHVGMKRSYEVAAVVKSRVYGGVENRGVAAQTLARTSQSILNQIVVRRQSGRRLEQAAEMKRAHTRMGGNLLHPDLSSVVEPYVFERAAHEILP